VGGDVRRLGLTRSPRPHELDQTIDELASRGVTFERDDQPGLKTDERGVFDGPGFRAAWIKDPDGNTLALTGDSG
jgi:hypothetical protein